MTTETKTKRPRGFAAMTQEQRSAISSKGGKAAHAAGTAHEFSRDEARVAGRKGGAAAHKSRRAAMADSSATPGEDAHPNADAAS